MALEIRDFEEWLHRIYRGMKLYLVECMVGDTCFCLVVECGYAEVLSCEKSYPGIYIHFCIWDAFSWIEAILVAALIFSGQFAAKWYVQIWIRWKKQLFWSKHPDILFTNIYLWRLRCRIASIPISLRGFWAGK